MECIHQSKVTLKNIEKYEEEKSFSFMRQFFFFLIYWLITVAAFMPRPSTDWLCVPKNNSVDGIVEGQPDALINKEFENLELGNMELFQLDSESEMESEFLHEDDVLSSNGLQLVSFSDVIYVPHSFCLAPNLTKSDLIRAVPVQRQRSPRLVSRGSSKPASSHSRVKKSSCHKPDHWEMQDPCGLWRLCSRKRTSII